MKAKARIIEVIKNADGKVAEAGGCVYADFKRERNAELTAKYVKQHFPEVRWERAFSTLKLYF